MFLLFFHNIYSISQIYGHSFIGKEASSVSGNFTIDKSLGRDVKIEINYKEQSTPLSLHLEYPDGTKTKVDVLNQPTFIYTFQSPLEVSMISFSWLSFRSETGFRCIFIIPKILLGWSIYICLGKQIYFRLALIRKETQA